MAEELKMETKCYDANEYGYLYGLNQRIPDEEFEKVKPYMRDFRRKDFVDGIEILGIENTLQKRQDKIKKAFADPIAKVNLKDNAYNWLNTLFKKTGTHPKQNLSRLALHSTKIYDPDDSFKKGAKDGEGVLFIYTPHGMWYIINNCGENSDTSLNNVESNSGGAIGYRLMYDDTVDTLIRIYTEENEYTGEKLY